jgi:hypothetical protein
MKQDTETRAHTPARTHGGTNENTHTHTHTHVKKKNLPLTLRILFSGTNLQVYIIHCILNIKYYV